MRGIATNTTQTPSSLPTLAPKRELTLPQHYVVGAGGVQTGEHVNSDGSKTLSFRGEDIHDFAWAASPHFQTADDTFFNSLGSVKLHALILPSHVDQRERYLSILKQSMQKFDDWYGPYPYKQITLIDPEPDSAAAEMEYPTLIVGGMDWWEPSWSHYGWKPRSPTSLATSTGTVWSPPMSLKSHGSTKASTATAKTK